MSSERVRLFVLSLLSVQVIPKTYSYNFSPISFLKKKIELSYRLF